MMKKTQLHGGARSMDDRRFDAETISLAKGRRVTRVAEGGSWQADSPGP